MKRLFAVALGVLTAIGGSSTSAMVTNPAVGSRFGLSLVWVVVVGVLGICVFAEMSGRVAAVSGRATFDLIREPLGPRVGWPPSPARWRSPSSPSPPRSVAWPWPSARLEPSPTCSGYRSSGCSCGWCSGGEPRCWRTPRAGRPRPDRLRGRGVGAGPGLGVAGDRGRPTRRCRAPRTPVHWFYAVALFGAAMTPYEVFFFSSGGVEEKWDRTACAPCAPTCSSASRWRVARWRSPPPPRSSCGPWAWRSPPWVRWPCPWSRHSARSASCSYSSASSRQFRRRVRDPPVGRLQLAQCFGGGGASS